MLRPPSALPSASTLDVAISNVVTAAVFAAIRPAASACHSVVVRRTITWGCSAACCRWVHPRGPDWPFRPPALLLASSPAASASAVLPAAPAAITSALVAAIRFVAFTCNAVAVHRITTGCRQDACSRRTHPWRPGGPTRPSAAIPAVPASKTAASAATVPARHAVGRSASLAYSPVDVCRVV